MTPRSGRIAAALLLAAAGSAEDVRAHQGTLPLPLTTGAAIVQTLSSPAATASRCNAC
jgi:hypothetical protein